jgi:hypothetical protein
VRRPTASGGQRPAIPDPVTLRTATGTPAAEAQIVSLMARTLTEFDQKR